MTGRFHLFLGGVMIVAGNTSVVTSEREGIINNQETSFSIKDELIQESVLMPIFFLFPLFSKQIRHLTPPKNK